MAVPKQHTTKSRRNRRRANIFLSATDLSICPKCGKPIKPHFVCGNCGYYKGRQVIDVLEKLNKKQKKEKQKEIENKKQIENTKKPLTMEELSKKKF